VGERSFVLQVKDRLFTAGGTNVSVMATTGSGQRKAIGHAVGNSTEFLRAVQVQYNIAIVQQTMSPHLWNHSQIQTLEDGTKRLVLTQRPIEVITL